MENAKIVKELFYIGLSKKYNGSHLIKFELKI